MYQSIRDRVFLILFLLLFALPCISFAGGVTIIVHGWNSGTVGWVTGMKDGIVDRLAAEGKDATAYTVSVTRRLGILRAAAGPRSGSDPIASNSGEIIILLDWSTLAQWPLPGSATTTAVANAFCTQLRNSSFLPDLKGHALAELPIHIIGHSRGASLASEIARILGRNVIMIDHLTTLDGITVPGDAPIALYESILFADNYWRSDGGLLRTTGKNPFNADYLPNGARQKSPQRSVGAGDTNRDPDGQAVAGAYNRRLNALDTETPDLGYALEHEDIHLWYQGTVDPMSGASDSVMPITEPMRSSLSWWTAAENRGLFAGYYYSRIGGGDRLSEDMPVAGGDPIRAGYNALLGGTGARVALPALTPPFWPNLVTFDMLRAGTPLVPGEYSAVAGGLVTFQYAGIDIDSPSTVEVWLDRDQNPLNSNSAALLSQRIYPATGRGVYSPVVTRPLPSLPDGVYYLTARISDGHHKRFLVAPAWIRLE